jgi:SAM-dependent methyltransferase
MNRATVLALDAINRDFYRARAAEWNATREAPWPGWDRVLEHLRTMPGPANGARIRILDVGCGGSRLERWLETSLARPHRYVGLDRSLPLVALGRAARRTGHDSSSPAWLLSDLLDSDGELPCRAAAFDAAVAFGLLHHLPSFALRRAFVSDLLRLLPRGGIAALAFWQLGAEARFERRVVPWEHAAGVDREQLEPGDLLLQWGASPAGGSGTVRYCHHADPAEVDRLTSGLPAVTVDTFRADGRGGALNLYRVLRRD